MAPSSPDGFILRHDDSPMEATVNEIRPAHWRASGFPIFTWHCRVQGGILLDFLEHNDSDTLYLVGTSSTAGSCASIGTGRARTTT